MKLMVRGKWLFLVALIVVGAAAMLWAGRGTGETVTPERLEDYIQRVMREDVRFYQTGRQNYALSKAGRVPPFESSRSRMAFYGPIVPYLSVEFLRTLTPDQVAAIRGSQGKLYYKNLRPDQQQLLTLRYKFCRLESPQMIYLSPKVYQTSFGRFEASEGSCPNLSWHFPDVKTGDPTRVAKWSNSISANW